MSMTVSESHASSPIEALLTIMNLIEAADQHQQGHGIRTARHAVAMGHEVGFSPAELKNLCLASLLHDIGLLTLPRQLLEKEGPPSDEEYSLLQSHPRAGAEMLAPIPMLRTAALWIAHHHERWDGFGYPYGLRGEFIPLGARILAVADTFDSLTSRRPFRPALDPDCAFRLLQDLAGSQLDPHLVLVFGRLLPDPPVSCGAANGNWGEFMVAGQVCAACPTGRAPFVPPVEPCPPHSAPQGDIP